MSAQGDLETTKMAGLPPSRASTMTTGGEKQGDPELPRTPSTLPIPIEETQEKPSDPYEVTLAPEDDPQNLPLLRKWVAVWVVSFAAICVTVTSSAAAYTEVPLSAQFHVPEEVGILTVSLYVEGLGLGPLIIGPLSELYGRNIIYQIFYGLFFVFSLPVAFAPNAPVLLVFRFLAGFCGSAFLSVAGGTISDLFTDATVATPMMVYSISPFIGPVLGPLMAGFIVQNLNWRWVYRILSIWSGAQYIFLFLIVPETYVPTLLQRKAASLRKSTGDSGYWAPLDRQEKNLAKNILHSCWTPLQLIYYDRMVLLLNIWTSLLLGILYLSFQAFPYIFRENHGFNIQMTGLTFIGVGLGMLSGCLSQPYWNKRLAAEAEKNGGKAPPEARLSCGKAGAILCPIGLFWLAFTTYPSVHWIVPIIACIPFGVGICFAFSAVFTYLVTAYRPIAASAMSSNSAMRSTFAAIFPLFSSYMYNRLGTVGATALLAGLTTLMTPLPFIYSKIGARLRSESRFAAK